MKNTIFSINFLFLYVFFLKSHLSSAPKIDKIGYFGQLNRPGAIFETVAGCF